VTTVQTDLRCEATTKAGARCSRGATTFAGGAFVCGQHVGRRQEYHEAQHAINRIAKLAIKHRGQIEHVPELLAAVMDFIRLSAEHSQAPSHEAGTKGHDEHE